MLFVPLVFVSVIIGIVFLLKHVRASILHYQRPELFPPGPSQVCCSKVKTWNLLKNVVMWIQYENIFQFEIGTNFRKYTISSQRISKSKWIAHAKDIQIHGRYIWSNNWIVFGSKTNSYCIRCNSTQRHFQARECNIYLIYD